jgi:hypothetical protein
MGNPKVAILTGAILAAAVSTTTYAQPNKEAYELHERCGRRAAEMFEKDFGPNPNNGQVLGNYENHYNTRLNKCFIVESTTEFLHDPGKTTTMKTLELVDVNENKLYGSFNLLECVVNGKTCHSEEEWRTLTKSYMEE